MQMLCYCFAFLFFCQTIYVEFLPLAKFYSMLLTHVVRARMCTLSSQIDKNQDRQQ